MALEKITEIKNKGVYVSGDDIDTDRIIPARFMKCVTFDGLGQYAFYDVRFDKDNKSLNHELDQHKDAQILISGTNFGCGSSREHAPQALYYWGIRAIIAKSFAEIFFGNSITLGIPCVISPQADIIGEYIKANPNTNITIDIVNNKIILDNNNEVQEYTCTIESGARDALINGKWDPIAELIENKEDIAKTHSSLPMATI